MQALSRLSRRIRLLRAQGYGSLALVSAVFIFVEAIGRQTRSDAHDAAIMAGLGLVLALVVRQHLDRKIAWVGRIYAAAKRVGLRLLDLGHEIGVDLRGHPPVRRGLPPLYTRVFALFAGIAAAVGSWVLLVGHGFRDVVAGDLYLPYLTMLVCLWALLLGAIAMHVLMPVIVFHDMLVARHTRPGPRSRRLEYAAVAAYLAALVVAGLSLPAWVPAAMLCASYALTAVSLAADRGLRLALLWRGKRGSARGETRSVAWKTVQMLDLGALCVFSLLLILIALGPEAVALPPIEQADQMPVTTALGACASWVLAGGQLCFALLFLWTLRRLSVEDPSRPCPTVVSVQGPVVEPARLRFLLAKHGVLLREPGDVAERGDVPLRLVSGVMPKVAPGGERRWPLSVSLKGLEVPELLALIRRRDEYQRRRMLVKGFAKLFKRAASRSFAAGNGFWLAPHFWFMEGMTRDVEEDEIDAKDGAYASKVVGPYYHLVFPRAARQHFHEIARSLEVDLVFVEDGLGFARFRQVLRFLFERFDLHGGSQRLDEAHFSGLPGVRALIHDFEFGRPLRKADYPEPAYEHFGRARVLHLFRDRGDRSEEKSAPVDLSSLPQPVGVR